ncbi:RNA polymerase sigma factor [Butyrivibrio sp. FCS014]|uniref:RNA polymerase sigma factor n=1 Tax=Butyrivibrio sp. FCS014 TaxID=1408304 RepID=UPI000464F414|nr:sigma-70 family RNA polymerase sigma factor [Butyrivibrio sp. FCS014]
MKNMMKDICSNETLNALVEAYRGGDEGAFDAIYKECEQIAKDVYNRKIYGKERYPFDDLFHEAITKAWMKLDSFDAEKGTFRCWFWRIFYNTCMSGCEYTNAHSYAELSSIDESSIRTKNPSDFWKEGCAEEGDPGVKKLYHHDQELIEDEITSQESLDELLQCMEKALSDEQNEAIYLFYFENKSIADVAKMQGCSEATVKSRLHQGRNKLRVPLEELGLAS